jgi:hypothetical protein
VNTSDAASYILSSWYGETAAVRRLWAFHDGKECDEPAVRVIVMLEPSVDGDDTVPAWMADCARWTQELGQRLAHRVHLERVDEPPAETFRDDGVSVLSVLCWRDATAES